MPYNPGNWGVYQQGLANFSQGLSGASDAIAAGIKDWSQKKDLTQSLRAMFSAVDPEHKDMYQTMGLPDLQGKLQSYSLQHTLGALKQQQQQQQEEQAIGTALKRYSSGPSAPPASPDFAPYSPFESEASGPQAETTAPAGLPSYSATPNPLPAMPGPGGIPAMPNPYLLQAPQPPASNPAPTTALDSGPSRDERVRYALATPGLGGTGAVRLLSALQSYHNMRDGALLPVGAVVPAGDAGTIVGTGTQNQFVAGAGKGKGAFFTRDDLANAAEVQGAPGWRRITTGPNASQLVYTMGAAPDVAAMTAKDGKPTGQLGYFDGKRWVRFEDPTYSGPAIRLVDENGETIPGRLYHPQSKKEIDTRSSIEKAVGPTAGTQEKKVDPKDPLGIRDLLKK